MFLYDCNGDKLQLVEYRESAGFIPILIEIIEQECDPADCVGYQTVEEYVYEEE